MGFFWRTTGGPIKRFYDSWRAPCKTAGLVDGGGEADRLFHDFRRTGVRNLIGAGIPKVAETRISGHKTCAVFDRYNIVDESDLKDAARHLGGIWPGKRGSERSAHKAALKAAGQTDHSLRFPF